MGTSTAGANNITFQYAQARIKDLRPGQITGGENGGRKKVGTITIEGQEVIPTPRFWTSLFAKFGFGNSVFKLFTHDEVFLRISELHNGEHAKDKIRYCVEERNDGKPGKLLAISDPKRILIKHEDLVNLLHDNDLDTSSIDYGHNKPTLPPNLLGAGISNNSLITSSGPGGDGGAKDLDDVPTISYDTGVMRSVHTPRSGDDFSIGSDVFANRFVMDCPIDGYGKPNIYLMLLREVCTNHAIGYAKAFRSDISAGKKEDGFEYALNRAFEGFNNEEGFLAIRQRYESAATTWVSINEINRTYKLMARLHHKGEVRVDEKFLGTDKSSFDGEIMDGSPVIRSFHKMTGDLTQAYGLANLDALGAKRQRTLPAGCDMFTLFNFLTEVATHHTVPSGARQVHALVGDLLSAEYDLEGTKNKYSNWTDFLIEDKAAIESYTLAQRN